MTITWPVRRIWSPTLMCGLVLLDFVTKSFMCLIFSYTRFLGDRTLHDDSLVEDQRV